MSVDAGNLAKLSREEILADLIQRELRKTAVAWMLARDLSDRLRRGQKTTVIPRSVARSVSDMPNDGTELADAVTSYLKDTLDLDKFKTVYDYVYDKDQAWSSVDLIDDFYAEAPSDLAEKLEADMVAKIVSAGQTKPESGGANGNKFQLAGTDSGGNPNQAITLDQISDLAKSMTAAKIPKSNRYLMLSPKQAHELRIQDGIQDASRFGAGENPTVNGEITRLYGFIVVESQDLTDNQVVALHRDSLVKALAKEVSIDQERQSSKKRTFASVDAIYGVEVIRDGETIYFGDENV